MDLTLLYVLLLSMASLTTPQKIETSQITKSQACKEWVDSVYARLDTRERVAQLFVPHITPTDGDASKALIKKLVETDGVGGLLFTKGNIAEYKQMIDYAQSMAKVPLLITLDGEWGLSMRISETPRFPKNMALGAIQDERLLYAYGRETARECQALGIHANFAPVMDVNTNPANPVIGMRSYGSNPRRVAKLGTAYSIGMEEGGVLSFAKHFPGHGDTSTDSHETLSSVDYTEHQLDSLALPPFVKYINTGGSGIMIGHISLPQIDKSQRPASMSHVLTSDLLKNKLGFDGLVITDGLGMKGAGISGNNCVEALKAGSDLLLAPRQTQSDIDAVIAAIDKGEISAAQIESSCKKLLAYKYALTNAAKNEDKDSVDVAKIINSPESQEILRQLADAIITVVGNESKVLPIGNLESNKIAIVTCGPDKHNEFSDLCRRYADVDLYAAGELSHDKIGKYDIVVAAVTSDNAAARAELSRLSSAKSFVPVFLINPYKVASYADACQKAEAIVFTYEDLPELRRSAAKALFGGINVDGRLPVDISGVANEGDGMSLPKLRLGFGTWVGANMNPNVEQKLDSLIISAMESGAYPGCQILVARNGEVLIDKCYGVTTKGGNPVTLNTLYDLASVSKAVGTLPGVMKAYDLGLFEMDKPASDYIPGLNVPGKADITPRMLLFHETGIPASLNVFNVMMDSTTYKGKLLTSRRDKDHKIKVYDNLYGSQTAKLRTDIISRTKDDKFKYAIADGLYASDATFDTVMSRIYNIDVKEKRDYIYSCLNFALLMDLEQHVTGQNHHKWVADSVWSRIGAYGFCYRPTESHTIDEIAATENDTYLRKQHLRGYVHDEMAAFSGGLSGNAGVFGNAMDVAKMCQTWLNGGWYGDARIYSRATNHMFTTEKSKISRRGLGFDKPDIVNLDNSPCCDEASPEVFGHTGYTGTCFWVDPNYQLIFVFLNNRVDPSRNNSAWSKASVRPALMSALYEAINDK